MLTRFNCPYCKGTGYWEETNDDCICGDWPNYREILDGDWKKTGDGGEYLLYAVSDDGKCLIIHDNADVFIGGMGKLSTNMTPRDLAELSALARALKMRVV